MRSDLSTFARRMEICSMIIQKQNISQLELSRYFSVSEKTISRDIIALSDYVSFSCNTGRHGGFALIENYKADRVYLSHEEEAVIRELAEQANGRKKFMLKAILHKFALPQK